MIQFNNIIVEGFCSIGELEYNLSNNQLVVIRGRNGSGKTTFLSAITWVLFGKINKDINSVIPWQGIRQKNFKGTKVQIFFKKDNVVYSVIRCKSYKGDVLGSKGNDRLILLIDNEQVKQKSKPEIQREIEKHLGLSYQIFQNSIMFGQGMKKIISESGSDKKKLFEDILDIDYINKAKEIAQSRFKELSASIDKLNYRLESTRSSLNSAKNTNNLLKDSEDKFKKEIAAEKNKVKGRITELQEQYEKINFNQVALTKATSELSSLKKSFEELSEENSLLNKSLSLSKISSTIRKAITNIHDNTDKSKSILINLLNSLDRVDELPNIKRDLVESMNSVSAVIRTEKSHKSEKSNIEYLIKGHKDRLKDLSKKKFIDKSDKSKSKLDLSKLREKLKSEKLELQALKKDLENYEWLIKDPLGNKGIKSFLIESSLDSLNKTLNKYSDILGFSISFGIDLNSTKRDFFTTIILDGNYVDYEELSGGQKQLVNLTMALAMNESCISSKGLNLLFLDEIFESLDSENIEIVIELLKSISNGKVLYIITHQHSIPLSNAKLITAVKEKGLTRFE